jgi:gliding motility-associated-like protein
VSNCVFFNNNLMDVLTDNGPGANDDAGAHGIVIYGDDNEVSNCIIDGSAACSYDFVFDGSAIEIFGGSRNFIHHNLARQNVTFTELGGQAIIPSDNIFAFNIVTSDLPISNFVVTRGGATGSAWGPVNGTRVYNNTVFLTGSYAPNQAMNVALVCAYGCDGSILTFKNNIIIALNRIEATDQRTSNESNNIFWDGTGQFLNNWLTWSILGVNSAKLDPKLVDVYAGDFTPQSTSPVISRGTPVSEVFALGLTTDFSGSPLPSSGNIDVGAIQFPIPGSFRVDAGVDQLLRLPASSASLVATTASSYTDYFWEQVDGPTLSLVTKTSDLKASVINLVKGEYRFKVTITSALGEEAFDEMIVRVVENQQPLAQAGPDIRVVENSGEVAIQGVGTDPDGSIVSFLWSQIDGPTGVIVSDPSASLLRMNGLEPGVYEFELTVTDNEGLTGSDRVLVICERSGLTSAGIPQLFSPNNDGVHDVWEWQNIERFKNCVLKIFDQFGRKVFEAAPYENNWDGTYHGALLEEEAYFYVVSCGNEVTSGGVRIIR